MPFWVEWVLQQRSRAAELHLYESPAFRRTRFNPSNKIAAAVVATTLMGRMGTTLIAVLILVCTFGALNGCIISYPRIYYRMAQEKVFFKKAAWVHPSYKTPYIALIYSGAWSCLLVITGTFDRITDLVIFSSYLFLGLTAIGLIKMKSNGKITKGLSVIRLFPGSSFYSQPLCCSTQ